MSGQRRRRLGTDRWREVMQRFEAAGETVNEFCAREGLSASSFYRWRERLEAVSGVVATARPRQSGAQALQPSAAGFIDLGSLAGASRDSCAGLELRLDIGGGVMLQIVRR